MALLVEIVDALKRLLKSRGITYAALARHLALSETSVKRMFSQRTITLRRLEQICDVLDVGMAELAAESHRHREALAELDVEQEQALVDDNALLLALYLVLNRWSETDVLARYRFTRAQWTLLLTRLDRLGIIELLPGNRTRARTARNFRWRRGGPMERFFQKELLPSYFRASFAQDDTNLLLLSGMITPESAAEVHRRLDEVAEAFDQLMARDAALPATQRTGVSLVLAQRPWTLSYFAKYRRAG